MTDNSDPYMVLRRFREYVAAGIALMIIMGTVVLVSYCQELCMGKLGGDPFFFNSIDKVYSPDYFC